MRTRQEVAEQVHDLDIKQLWFDVEQHELCLKMLHSRDAEIADEFERWLNEHTSQITQAGILSLYVIIKELREGKK